MTAHSRAARLGLRRRGARRRRRCGRLRRRRRRRRPQDADGQLRPAPSACTSPATSASSASASARSPRSSPRATRSGSRSTYDAQYDVPADAKAVVVAPSIVSDRYVQLTPVYQRRRVLEDGAVLGTDRTAVPVELDEIYASLDKLNVALGPKGANKDGALSDLRRRRRDEPRRQRRSCSTARCATSRTLVRRSASQRGDLFGTVANLQDFTTTIANSDATVRRLQPRPRRRRRASWPASATTWPPRSSSCRWRSARSPRSSARTRTALTANVSDLADVTGVLVKQRKALEEFLDVVADGAVQPAAGLQPDVRARSTPATTARAGGRQPGRRCCATCSPSAGQDARLLRATGAAASPGLARPAPRRRPRRAGPRRAGGSRDMTLGGILDGGR